jgi:cytoskeletal protein RodZ
MLDTAEQETRDSGRAPNGGMAMVAPEKQAFTPQQRKSRGRERQSARRRYLPVIAGVLLLALALAAVTAGCGSNAQEATGTTAAGATATTGQTGTQPSGQAGAPTGMPGGTPPTDANGQVITPPSGSTPPSGATSTSGNQSTTTTTAASNTASSTTSTTAAPTTTTSLAEGQYSNGIYLAGTDIDSGLYRGTVNSKTGHWEISSDANGDKYVASGDPTGPFYVKVKYGQYLRLDGVVIQAASTEAADPLATSNLSDGTYRVGYDIEAGWYHGTVNDGMGYWEVSSDANGTSLVASDYPLGSFTLKVKDGQYLTLRGVTVSQ